MYFWTSLISGFKKCHFYFYAMSRNAQNRSLKSSTDEVINGYGLGLSVCHKYIYQPKIRHARCTSIPLQHISGLLKILKTSEFEKTQISVLLTLWIENLLFWKSEIAIKKLFILRLLMLLFAFCFKFLFLVIFLNIYQFSTKMAQHWITKIGIIQELLDFFPKLCVRT